MTDIWRLLLELDVCTWLDNCLHLTGVIITVQDVIISVQCCLATSNFQYISPRIQYTCVVELAIRKFRTCRRLHFHGDVYTRTHIKTMHDSFTRNHFQTGRETTDDVMNARATLTPRWITTSSQSVWRVLPYTHEPREIKKIECRSTQTQIYDGFEFDLQFTSNLLWWVSSKPFVVGFKHFCDQTDESSTLVSLFCVCCDIPSFIQTHHRRP